MQKNIVTKWRESGLEWQTDACKARQGGVSIVHQGVLKVRGDGVQQAYGTALIKTKITYT